MRVRPSLARGAGHYTLQMRCKLNAKKPIKITNKQINRFQLEEMLNKEHNITKKDILLLTLSHIKKKNFNIDTNDYPDILSEALLSYSMALLGLKKKKSMAAKKSFLLGSGRFAALHFITNKSLKKDSSYKGIKFFGGFQGGFLDENLGYNDKGLERKFALEVIEKEMDVLDSLEKKIIGLYYLIGGLEYKDLANILGISIKKVAIKKASAIRKLRKSKDLRELFLQ
jgi:DNA-directed RNA polymerase specialized sigma subunit